MKRPTQAMLPAVVLVGATLLMFGASAETPSGEGGRWIHPAMQRPESGGQTPVISGEAGTVETAELSGSRVADGPAGESAKPSAADPGSSPAAGSALPQPPGAVMARGPVVVQAPKEPQDFGPPWRLAGRVLDPQGWPVVGATVSLRNDRGAPLPGGMAVPVDADGVFVLRGRGAEPVLDLWVEAADHTTAWVAAQPSLGDPVNVVLRPSLPWAEAAAPDRPEWPMRSATDATQGDPGAVVSRAGSPKGGLIGEGFVESVGGNPLDAALITVAETGLVARSDSTGRFRVPLPQGMCTLLVQDGAGHLQTRTIPAQDRDRGLVPLPRMVLGSGDRGRALRGLVRDPVGEPVAQGLIRVEGPGVWRTLASDASGRFGLAGLPEGEYRILVLPHRGSPAVDQTVSIRERDADFDVALAPTQPLKVRVVDRTAQPVAEAHVAAWWTGAAESAGEAGAAGELADRGGETLIAYQQAGPTGQLTLPGVGGLAPGALRFEVRRDADFRPLPVERATLEPAAGDPAELVVATY